MESSVDVARSSVAEQHRRKQWLQVRRPQDRLAFSYRLYDDLLTRMAFGDPTHNASAPVHNSVTVL
jgi:hypothetical protein